MRKANEKNYAMKTKLTLAALAMLALSSINHQLSTAHAQGTAFTYEGQLNNNGSPANGIYDIRAGLYLTSTGGVVSAGPITNPAVVVSNGLFTITLDYGNVFDGTTYWLQVAVRSNGLGGFTILSPRQELTPTPYAIFAEGANAAGLSGTIPPGSLAGAYGGVVNFTNPADIFLGNGAGLSGVNAATLGGLASSNFWKTTGNSGTTAGANFAGTIDNNSFEIHVNSTRIWRAEPDSRGLNAGNLIGGHPGNAVLQPGSGGNVIGGGGFGGGANLIGTNSSGIFIGAGSLNEVGPSVNDSVIAGGYSNTNQSPDSGIGGGLGNWIQPSSQYSFIGGGYRNVVSDYYTIFGGTIVTNNTAFYATVVGGISNNAYAAGSFVGGGGYDGQFFGGNKAQGPGSVIGGGIFNIATGQDAVVGGGSGNVAGPYATVGGGQYNGAGGLWGTVAGGQYNQAEGYSAVGGGQGNSAGGILASNCTVGGGAGNIAGTADSGLATVSGGYQNWAAGVGSFIGGGGTDGNNNGGNLAGGQASVIGGGMNNTNNGYASTIGGGFQNSANSSTSGFFYGGATVAGGEGNKASTDLATVGGGIFNTASGVAATVPGGSANLAGGLGSFAAGQSAQTTHGGTFIWGDGSQTFTGANVDDAFNVLATGGVFFYDGTNGLHIDGFGNNDGTIDYGLKFGGALSSGEGIASKRTAGGNQYGLDFYTSSADRMSIAANGFVGINTTSPSERLEVNGQFVLIDGANAGNGNGPLDAYIGGDGSGSDVQIGSMNSLITAVGFWNYAANAWMHISCSSITIHGGADLAEPFPITAAANEVPPGAVVVIDAENPGGLKLSEQAYDSRVAGVVSGANGVNPGIQMQQQGLLEGGKNVALTGRVYVQADASNGPIQPGDLLTTSGSPGRAMKVTDHAKAQGAILGKAMTGLKDGNGMVLVLVTLQ